ncbi:MAG TPA: hypothetical protein P5539_14295 [Mesotoga sp.]|nr:hypothetical protein [Mesotoga sp.]
MPWYINSMGDAHNLSNVNSLIVSSSENTMASIKLPESEKQKYFDGYMIVAEFHGTWQVLEFVSEYDEGKKLISYILSRVGKGPSDVVRYEETIPMLK